MKDTDLMPWGVHKGKRMIDVPDTYLRWLFDNNKCTGDEKKYIEDNLDSIKMKAKLNKGNGY